MTTTSTTAKSQRSVEFLSDGLNIRGVLCLPEGAGPFPIVILGHGLGAYKEWVIPEVAASLVEVGIAGLSFDYRKYGDSEGEPREEIDHYGRIDDWHNAIAFAATLPEIDPECIGIWGTSLGGRDVLAVAAIDRHVKAVVCLNPLIKWIPQVVARMAGYGDDLARFQQELDEDRRNRILGKSPRYLPFVKPSGDDAKGAYIASLTEVERRNYKGQITLQSYQPTALVDVMPLVKMIAPTPLLFVIAEEDYLPGQREAYDAAQEPKSLLSLKGNHFAPYMESKEKVIRATKEWFVEHLVGR